jgi:outer membrane protein TolC
MTKSTLHRDRNRARIFTAIFFICVPLLRGENRPLSLHQCINIALGQSPKIEADHLDLLAATKTIFATRSSYWPTLTASNTGEFFSGEQTGKFGIVLTPETGGGGVNANHEVSGAWIGLWGLHLTYPVFRDGSIFGLNDVPAVERDRAQQHALEWTTHLTREEVIYRIAQAYIVTVSAQNRAEPVDRRVSLLERSLAITKEQQGKGLVIPADVGVIKEELNGARALSKLIHDQEEAGALSLTRMLGMTPSQHINLVQTLPEPPQPPSASLLLERALSQHPSLGVQRAAIDKAKQNWRLERFRLYPSVSIQGSGLYVSDFDKDAHVIIAGVTVQVPIFDFGSQLATVRARKDTYAAEQARLGGVIDDISSQILSTYDQIYTLSGRMLTLRSEIGKLDRDLRVAQSKQQQGIGEPLTAIDAELQLVGKSDELAVDEAHRILLYASLQRATGGTWKWLP